MKIENQTAFVDFSEELERGVGGSCRVLAIRRQIEATLKQFPTVDRVIVSIDGRTEDILQPQKRAVIIKAFLLTTIKIKTPGKVL